MMRCAPSLTTASIWVTATALACTNDYGAFDVSGLGATQDAASDAPSSAAGGATTGGRSSGGSGGLIEAGSDVTASGGIAPMDAAADQSAGGAGGGSDGGTGGASGGSPAAGAGGDTSAEAGIDASASDANADAPAEAGDAADAAADAASPQGGDAGDPCAQYTTAPGYVACGVTATACVFAARTMGNCESMCALLGGLCLDADDNATPPCVITNAADTCQTNRMGAICTCTRP